ncbi:MAG: hypothetical protein KAI24_01745 [Planctomycetes bacterium]|nr:hypothetical protein [Planctomycetota bacterium]
MTRLPILLFLSFVVVGCDSGGGAAAVTPTATFQPSIAVTVDRAPDVAKVGVRAAYDLPNLAYIGASFLRKPLPADPNAQGNPNGQGNPTGQGNPATLAVTRSATVSGPNGGAATYSWEDVRGDGIYSTDDVVTIQFDGYVDGDLTLDGLMVIDDLRALGVIAPVGGTWVVDATLRLIGLQVGLGAGTFSFDVELPFRLESRSVLVEIFDLFLFEDLVVGLVEVKQNTRWLRYTTQDERLVEMEGHAYSPELDGLVRFASESTIVVNTFTGNPVEGVLVVSGAGRSRLEVQATSICSLPIPLPCMFDVRVDEDGDETFEATLQVSENELLPQ